tara:strand:- start:463 stop:1431 length:969 start_codon:yes stop_codon:yes gene_type:complete
MIIKFNRNDCIQSLFDYWNLLYTLHCNYDKDAMTLSYNKVIEHLKSCIYNKKLKLADKIINYLIVICFDTRNYHCGLGWKDCSYDLYFKLLEICPKTMIDLLPYWVEFGYWKDYQNLYRLCQEKIVYEMNCNELILFELQKSIETIWIKQLIYDDNQADYNYPENISYCAKFFPKENKSLDKKYKIFTKIAEQLFPNSKTNPRKQLRKMIQKIKNIKKKDRRDGYVEFEKHTYIQQINHLYDLYPFDIQLFTTIMEHSLYKNLHIFKFSNNNTIRKKLMKITLPKPVVLKSKIESTDYQIIEKPKLETNTSFFQKIKKFLFW